MPASPANKKTKITDLALRVRPLIQGTVNRKIALAVGVVLAGTVLGALALGGGSGSKRPAKNEFAPPEPIELPEPLRRLPDAYGAPGPPQTKPAPAPQAPPPPPAEDSKTLKELSAARQMLDSLQSDVKQLALASRTELKTLNQTMDQKLARFNTDLQSNVQAIRKETQASLEQMKKMQARAATPPKPAKPAVDDKMRKAVNESPILFGMSTQGHGPPQQSQAPPPAPSKAPQPPGGPPGSRQGAPAAGAPAAAAGGSGPQEGVALRAGTFIPASLITGIDTSLPGPVIAQVRENVFDTDTGRYLLLPQGSKIVGDYKSLKGPGARRVDVTFSHILRPDGTDLPLTDRGVMADNSGQSGLGGEVDNHWGQVALTTVLTAAFNIGIRNQDSSPYYNTDNNMTVRSADDAVRRGGNYLAERLVPEGPTIHIDPGEPFNIIVRQDLFLPPYAY